MQILDPETAPPCVHCGHPYSAHKRHPASANVAVYVPCTVCNCLGYASSDPFADDLTS